MADKRRIQRTVKAVEKVKTWQLVILLLMAGFVAATFLRLNNIGMIERRDAVWAADKTGDVSKVQDRLYDLQRYVASHMNTDPGRVQLDHAYKKAYDQAFAEFEQSIASQSSNDTVSKIREHCDAQAAQGGYGRFTTTADPRYVACINEQWDLYPAASQVDYVFMPPSTAPYYHTFSPPLWSADFAGWSVLFCLFIVVIIIIRLVTLAVLKLTLHLKYRRV